MKRVLMSLAVVLTTVGSSDAGPIRNFVQRIRGGGCGSCQSAPVQSPQAAPVTMPTTGALQLVRHGTSYEPPAVAGGVQYQPIRLTAPLPVCPGGVCR